MIKTKSKNRLLALILSALLLLGSLPLTAEAASIGDGSASCNVTLGPGQHILKTHLGTMLGAWAYSYTTNDGTTGAAFCINHGLHYTARTLPIAGKYTASPQAAGALANGYPSHDLSTFLGLCLASNPILSGLTEEEYAYATQCAIWATLGQLGIAGTSFTAGREYINEPTGDTQQMRVFRAIQLILTMAQTWDRIYQTGMYIRLDDEKLGGDISIAADMTLEYAADNERYGFKREVINGTSYYTREYTFASATSTYYSGYHIELWADGAPSGTIFTDLSNNELTHGTFREQATWRLPVSYQETTLNSNGFEYSGKAKLCIPVDTVPNSGEITVRCGAYVMQYEIYLAKNEEHEEQSYIIADPSKGVETANAVIMWGGPLTETGVLRVTKVSGSGLTLAGAEFELSGTDGQTRTGTTDANGIVQWDALNPAYTYTLTETKAPDGYGIVEPIQITIKAARTNFVTVQDTVQKQLTIKKVDRQTGYSLQGAVMKLEQIDGSFETTGTTDPAGVVQFDADQLPIGSYKVYEVTPPEGYELDTTPQTVHWEGTRDITLTFRNVRKPTLTIYKCDEGNHYSLPYATFEVYKNGQLVTTVTTNQNGLAYVPDVTTGYYTVKETIAPSGYVLDSSEHSIYVNNYDPATTDDPRIVVSNQAMPMLRIVKYDEQTMEALPNTAFEVYRDTELLGRYETNADGEILLNNLTPGTYLVKEVAATPGYVVNSTPQEIELEAGATNYTLVFLNLLKPGIYLKKLDSQTMEPLINARFRVSQIGGGYSKEYLTDANGEISLTGLTPASYTVEELAAPDGYLIDDAQRVIQIEGGENASFVFTNTKKPALTIVKYDAERSTPLHGATFRIAKIEDGTHYLDRITDLNGKITVTDLEPGVYSVQEIEAPSGYIRNETEYHVQLYAGQTSQLVVCNDAKPDLKIVKKDADDGTPLAGAVFKVSYADGSTLTSQTTDENGEILLAEMNPGTYQVTEVTPPDGYLNAETATQLITLEPNKLGTVIFENHAQPTLTVNKVDSITKDPIQGARFHVTYASNNSFTGEINDLGYYYSDSNGQFKLQNLSDGWYRVEEVETAAGYAMKQPSVQQFFIKSGTSKTVTFENIPLSALIVKKTDSVTGTPLQGAWFRVRLLSGTSGTGGTVIAERQTSVNGSFVLTGLAAGTYIVEELAAPKGYVLSKENTQTVYLSGKEQDVITVEFTNDPLGSLLIKKVCSVNPDKLLEGAQFKVTYTDGTLLGDSNGCYETDANGEILITDLEPNKSVLVAETRAPEGYVIDTTPQTAAIKSGKTVTLTFANAPKGSIIVEKRDSITNQLLPGAEFRITTAAGCEVGQNGVIGEATVTGNGLFTTDATGKITVTGLKPGTYIITETKAPDGYLIDDPTRTVTVTAGDTQTIVFQDTPLGGLQIIKTDEDSGERIKGAKFEIQKLNGEVIGTYTTDSNGIVYLPKAESGWYTVTELKAAEGYKLDATPHQIEVKDGSTATLKVTNVKAASLIIHKTDSVTDKGIYGVTFVIYDSGKNPVEQVTTDQQGYAYLDRELTAGKYYLREIEAAEGYLADHQYKTVYASAGKTSTVEWENTPVTGQIQITKYAAEDNTITGQSAGTKLSGAVYEIVRERSGVVACYVTTDSRGIAASEPLPLGRYIVREVSAPTYWQVSAQSFDVTLEYAGQIIKLSDYDKPAELGVTLTKTGNREVLAGSKNTYRFTIANTSNVNLDSFYWHDKLPYDVSTASALTTGTYNQRLTYRILYKTNYSDYRVLASNLLSTNNYAFALSALPLQYGEVVTDIYFDFGTVPTAFQSITQPTLTVSVSPKTVNGYYLVNRADAGGKYCGTWETANASWLTVVRNLTPVNSKLLPKTGY